MPTSYTPSEELAAIRSQLDHPIIDGDGHHVEFLPAVEDFVRQIAGTAVAKRFHDIYGYMPGTPWNDPLTERRESGVIATGFWTFPRRTRLIERRPCSPR